MEDNGRKSLFASFVKFQSEFRGLKADSSNPYFKTNYISLDGILETARPLLAKHDLAVMQEATSDGTEVTVKTILIHSSGEQMETGLLRMTPEKANNPQAMGSCITYAKRYQLGALLGICESVDDDGNGASKPATTKQDKPGAKTPSAPPTQTAPSFSELDLDPPVPPRPEEEKCKTLFRELGLQTEDEMNAWLESKKLSKLGNMPVELLMKCADYLEGVIRGVNNAKRQGAA